MPGEFDLIAWIRAQQKASPLVRVGIGDDLAVLSWPAGDLLIVGVDQVLDGIHFDSAVHSPHDIGQKVMNRNLSDCAAMACLPAAAVATVALPRGATLEYGQQLYLGMRAAADPFDCPLVGGDTASWPGKLAVTVTILGRSAGIEPITRAGAKVGDGIYVTGSLGGSILGRHMHFTPRIALARQLAKDGAIHAMIDLSDGLSRDLGHVCAASGVGAVVESASLPVHEDAKTLAARDGRPAIEHALSDGEDYELLFTSPREIAPAVATRIGQITADPGIWLDRDGTRSPLAPRGWEHPL